MIRRPPRSTLSSSSAASDVYKRQGLTAARDQRSIDASYPGSFDVNMCACEPESSFRSSSMSCSFTVRRWVAMAILLSRTVLKSLRSVVYPRSDTGDMSKKKWFCKSCSIRPLTIQPQASVLLLAAGAEFVCGCCELNSICALPEYTNAGHQSRGTIG